MKNVKKNPITDYQIEKDYASSLRRLVKNFTPKKNTKEEETTQKTEFRFKSEILFI